MQPWSRGGSAGARQARSVDLIPLEGGDRCEESQRFYDALHRLTAKAGSPHAYVIRSDVNRSWKLTADLRTVSHDWSRRIAAISTIAPPPTTLSQPLAGRHSQVAKATPPQNHRYSWVKSVPPPLTASKPICRLSSRRLRLQSALRSQSILPIRRSESAIWLF
jgi:hypothetical protein